MEEYGRFLALLASSLLVGFLSVILSLVWVFHYREGLSWDGGLGEFNWHPVLIITGFVFIQGIDCLFTPADLKSTNYEKGRDKHMEMVMGK